MKRLHLVLGGLLFAASALGGACGGKVAAGEGGSSGAAGGSGGCAAGDTYAEPGCGDPGAGVATLPASGCYGSCSTEGAPCVGGGSCQRVYVNPCICMPGMGCCAACGAEQLLCLP